MRLSDEQYEEIKKTVISTFVEYDVRCIPISAFEMATKMGLTVIPYSALSDSKHDVALKISEDGFSIEDNRGEWIIYYNDSCKNYGRINQTIMHEIGHYVLGHIEGNEQEEAEAKFFAKYALVPPPLVHNTCEKVTPECIMEVFDISFQAATIAYGYYNNWLKYGGKDYTDYEEQMLELFNVA